MTTVKKFYQATYTDGSVIGVESAEAALKVGALLDKEFVSIAEVSDFSVTVTEVDPAAPEAWQRSRVTYSEESGVREALEITKRRAREDRDDAAEAWQRTRKQPVREGSQ